MSVLSIVVMGRIVLERQMNVYFAIKVYQHTMLFVTIDVCFCTMKIDDSIITCHQTIPSIVVYLAIVNLFFPFHFGTFGQTPP